MARKTYSKHTIYLAAAFFASVAGSFLKTQDVWAQQARDEAPPASEVDREISKKSSKSDRELSPAPLLAREYDQSQQKSSGRPAKANPTQVRRSPPNPEGERAAPTTNKTPQPSSSGTSVTLEIGTPPKIEVPKVPVAASKPVAEPKPEIAEKTPDSAKQDLTGGAALNFKTDSGAEKRVLSSMIWRIRQTAAADEPETSWVIYHAGGRFYTSDKNVLQRVKRHTRLDKFTAPNNQEIYIASGKIDSVLEAVKGKHHPNAKSLIMTKWGVQQVQEPTFAVNRIREMARSTN